MKNYEYLKDVKLILESGGIGCDCFRYIDFDIVESEEEGIKIIPNNIIIALYLIGIIPTNPNNINKTNKLFFNKKEYSFNSKTKEFSIKPIK